jgi:hypothetical protein
VHVAAGGAGAGAASVGASAREGCDGESTSREEDAGLGDDEVLGGGGGGGEEDLEFKIKGLQQQLEGLRKESAGSGEGTGARGTAQGGRDAGAKLLAPFGGGSFAARSGGGVRGAAAGASAPGLVGLESLASRSLGERAVVAAPAVGVPALEVFGQPPSELNAVGAGRVSGVVSADGAAGDWLALEGDGEAALGSHEGGDARGGGGGATSWSYDVPGSRICKEPSHDDNNLERLGSPALGSNSMGSTSRSAHASRRGDKAAGRLQHSWSTGDSGGGASNDASVCTYANVQKHTHTSRP